MKQIVIYISLALLINSAAIAQKIKLSNTDLIKLDFKTLAEKKTFLKANDVDLQTAYAELINNANKLLNYRLVVGLFYPSH